MFIIWLCDSYYCLIAAENVLGTACLAETTCDLLVRL
jgi:hypothetical protein